MVTATAINFKKTELVKTSSRFAMKDAVHNGIYSLQTWSVHASLLHWCNCAIVSVGGVGRQETSSMLTALVIILFMGGHVNTWPGTTLNLKQIVTGRCYVYTTLVNPSSRYNCEEIWSEFEEAVIRRTPCSVRVKDYHRMFRAASQSLPCDKLLFWSKTRELMHSYAAVTESFWTLEDTLVGFMFNDLIWCGQQRKNRGFDFHSCPDWSTCVTHPVHSLWKKASQNFAAAACGNITVILNGSIENAFNRKSMFGGVELDNLNPRMVSHVHIKVVANVDGPVVENCSKGSILELIRILQTRGFRWSCTDNDVPLRILQCVKNPRQLTCQTCYRSLVNKKISHLHSISTGEDLQYFLLLKPWNVWNTP